MLASKHATDEAGTYGIPDSTQYHIVWVTRYSRKILCQGIDSYLKTLVSKEFKEFFPDIYVEEVGIDRDHIHIHCIIPPKHAVSKIVEAWKSNTSRLLSEQFPEFLFRLYWGKVSGAQGFSFQPSEATKN